MIKISKRLRALADLAGPCQRLIDVGTDHALLPVFMITRGLAVEAIGTEIKEGPLDRALFQVAEAGLEQSIRLLHCDGFGSLRHRPDDVSVIAGMGGPQIAHVLQEAKALDGVLWLQPNTGRPYLRQALAALGFCPEACYHEERGRLYHFWKLDCQLPRKAPRTLSLAEAFIGLELLEGQGPLLPLARKVLAEKARVARLKSRQEAAYLALAEQIEVLLETRA